MAARNTSHRLGLSAAIVLVCACGTGEVSQTVFSVESFCTLSPRIAVIVEISVPEGVTVDSVTAKHESEQHCYLEHSARHVLDDAEDAGEPSAALYSCLAQGQGTYTVRVRSGKHMWTQDVEVSGDDCHIGLQKLSFDL